MKRVLTMFAILISISLSGCGDSDDDEQIYSGEVDTKIVGTAPTVSNDIDDMITLSSASVAGKYGILWKPVADSGGNLVVLLARSWGKPSVRVLSMQKRVIETGQFVYYSNPNRATYRFKRPGRAFPSPCILQVGSKKFKIPNPSRRYE